MDESKLCGQNNTLYFSGTSTKTLERRNTRKLPWLSCFFFVQFWST